ncbi:MULTISPECIES: DUF21 domain-containing protein [unclassified Haladaptatus]|uniref:DUF21 domain-containing protein n=1 Tax=unclassified Haladaptatus TaxID=2622732 RepID=UPI0023E86E31|nr:MULTISPECIES: DUF21 domain-containing protein [unclassified Haladaptatus]
MVSFSVTLVAIVVLACLIALSAFFSSSETAIFTLPDSWFASQTPGHDSRVDTLADLRGDPHRLLVTLLVGNNVVNVAISSIITVLTIEYLSTGQAVTVATLVGSFVVLVFGEIVPKSYGLGNAAKWALTVAIPISFIERLLYPLVAFFDFITRRLNALLGGDSGIEQHLLNE